MSIIFGFIFVSSLAAIVAGIVLVLCDRPSPYRRCRACGYRLVGDAGARCPECGADLAGEGIRKAGTRGNPRRAYVGIALMLLGAVFSVWSLISVIIAIASATR